MMFELFSEPGDGIAIPAAKYTPTNMYETGTFMPGTLSFDNEPEGTWLLDNLFAIPSPMAPAMDGWVDVAKEGDNYIFKFEFFDGASSGPHKFDGTWTGKLVIDNQNVTSVRNQLHNAGKPTALKPFKKSDFHGFIPKARSATIR